ncbi:MAG TPA: hypothetical protein VJV75_04800, partial [Candidatus Polarisedimenticolia bacterium]|nr:hypothetical protein [Candidatus Polarisedimenticolia bacterium]
HVASHRRINVGFFSRHPARRILTPPPTDPGPYTDFLLEHVRRTGYDVIIAAGDDPTWALVQRRAEFAVLAGVPYPDAGTYAICRDKSLTMRAAERLGVPTPRTFEPDRDGIDAIAAALPFPVVIKPNVSDGARGISYPASVDVLRRDLPETVRRFGPCHVQEYIPQTAGQYKAEVLVDRDGTIRGWCAFHKIRYYPPSGGSSTLNRAVERPDALANAARILQGIGWYGLGDCDFIEDPRDGTLKLMEINPRFTRPLKVTVEAGVDFPLLMFRMARGESPAPMLTYRIGTMVRYLPADLAWFLRSPDRFRTRPGFLRTFVVADSDEVFTFKDPGPGLGYLLAMGLDFLHPKSREFRLRLDGPGPKAPRE